MLRQAWDPLATSPTPLGSERNDTGSAGTGSAESEQAVPGPSVGTQQPILLCALGAAAIAVGRFEPCAQSTEQSYSTGRRRRNASRRTITIWMGVDDEDDDMMTMA